MDGWLGRALRAGALVALALVALVGLFLTGLGLLAATDTGAARVGRLVVQSLDGALQGRFTVDGLVVRPDGVLELRGFRAVTPEGQVALTVARAVIRLNLVAVARREVDATVVLEEPQVMLEPGADGQLTIARVFSPVPDAVPTPARSGNPLSGWSFHFTDVKLHQGTVTWRSGGGSTLARATRLELAGAGGFAWAEATGRVKLTGAMETPLAGPLGVELDAHLGGGRLTVRRLEVTARQSRLDAVGWWTVEGDAFRLAVTHLAVARSDGAGMLPRAAPGADLAGTLYAESDGRRLTAATDLAGSDRNQEGRARAALALHLDARGPRALAFDAQLVALDPSRLLARSPPGRISLTARGGAVGPPGAWLGAGGGRLDLDRLEARFEGLSATGSLHWHPAGEVAGSLALDLKDLAATQRAFASLLPEGLPALSGEATVETGLSGSAAAPILALHARAAHLAIAGVELETLRLEASHDDQGESVDLQASAPQLGQEPLGLAIRLKRGPSGTPATLTELSLAWPGRRWTLAAPAKVTLAPLAVDRLVLQDGPQRLTLGGGWRADGRLEARLEGSSIDLALLPRRLLPVELDLGGTADFDLHLTGEEARPSLQASLEIRDGKALGLSGLRLRGTAGWSGEQRLLTADLGLLRGEGGTLALKGTLPLPLSGARGAAPIDLQLTAEALPLELLWPLLGVSPPLRGVGALQAALRGSADAPLLALKANLTALRWSELPPVDLEAAIDLDAGGTRAQALVSRGHEPLASVSAELTLDRAALLRRPGAALTALLAAPWHAALDLPGASIGWLAGQPGFPGTLDGLLSGHAELGGTPRAPRGPVKLSLQHGQYAHHRELSLEVEASLEPGRVTLAGQLQPEGAGSIRWTGTLGAPIERLGDPEVLGGAPLQLDLAARDFELAEQVDPQRELTGRMSATLATTGTLAEPHALLTVEGEGIAMGQTVIGEVRGTVRLEAGRASVLVDLAPAHGGSLHAEGSLGATVGIRSKADELLQAPLAGQVTAVQVDLGGLPAFFPHLIPAAQGTLDAELAVSGTLSLPRYTGRARTDGTRLTIAEYGTYTGIVIDATLDAKALKVDRFVVRRGEGRAEGHFTLNRFLGDDAGIDGEALVHAFTIGRSGIDYVTVDARLLIGGTLKAGRLDLEVRAPAGVKLLLPRKTPRTLQATDLRSDVVIGDPPVLEPGKGGAAGSAGARPAIAGGSIRARPFEPHIHFKVDSLLVKSDQPRVHVEVRTDSTWSWVDGGLLASGTIDLIHGSVEPMSGRIFKLTRAHVGFNGGPVGEAQLDIAADYDNPTAKVQVTVVGPLANPDLRLTSTPALDEASIAMLIATGRTEQTFGKGGSGTSSGTSTFTAQDAGMAAAMAVANKAFQDRLGDKMPLDTLTLDSTSVSAGKYVTDRVFVSYVRRFDARPDKGENTDEVRIQYQLTRRWTLESRYGNANAGGASILWQTDY